MAFSRLRWIAVVLLACSAFVSCGEPPPEPAEEVQSAFSFPQNGAAWYDSYWSTRKDCGIVGTFWDSGVGAVDVVTANQGGWAGVRQINDTAIFNPWTGTWSQAGAMPDPSEEPATGPTHVPQCALPLLAPTNGDADAAGIPRGSWAYGLPGNQIPCGVKLWGLQFGPIQPNTLPTGPTGYGWADWWLQPMSLGAPATLGWKFHSAGQIWNPAGQKTGCTYETTAYLYYATSPHQ